ncbi:hypothetical protein [uncultured Cohaesibacter sp.]|uniref:hypothetical protein n=1 Tax=uncultured Cohaesibacter sp. TaxID=1002546 RepID=UPI00292FBFF0|nr:hypothetical protein [uncultured Cohaesibacter sp.]
MAKLDDHENVPGKNLFERRAKIILHKLRIDGSQNIGNNFGLSCKKKYLLDESKRLTEFE